MKLISSKDNPFYKRLKQLAQSSAQRRKLGQTLLEGVHLADAYLGALGQPLVCVASETALENDEVAQIWSRVDPDRRVCLPHALFEPLSTLVNGVPLVFVVEMPTGHLPASQITDCVILDAVQDAGNVGSILRSAAAAGVRDVFCMSGTALAWSSKVLRAGMGAHFSLNIAEHCTPDSLAPRLSALEEVVAHYDLPNLVGPAPMDPVRYNWNWKVMFENNNDGYHANRLHRGPLHDPVPSRLASFPELPADTAGYYRINGSLIPDVSFNPTHKALLPVFPALTEAERSQVLFVNVPPTLSLVMNTDMVLYLIMQAEDADHHSMVMGSLVAPSALENPMFEQLMKINAESVQEIVSQDLHVDELVQIGLKSKFAPRGRYSWQEGAQRQFNVWLVDRYLSGWDAMKARRPQ